MPGYFTCNCMVTWSFAQGEDRRLAVHYDVVNVPETINANEPWGTVGYHCHRHGKMELAKRLHRYRRLTTIVWGVSCILTRPSQAAPRLTVSRVHSLPSGPVNVSLSPAKVAMPKPRPKATRSAAKL